MGKNKRLRLASGGSGGGKPKPRKALKPAAAPQKHSATDAKTTDAAKKSAQGQQHTEPTIPFKKSDRILLVGEGDLSFAASLVRHHGCKYVTATVYEGSLQELEAKYPHVPENIDIVENWSRKSEKEAEGNEGSDSDEEEILGDEVDWDEIPHDADDFKSQGDIRRLNTPRVGKIMYGVDATKMGPWFDTEAKAAGKGKLGAYDSIQFMFPHCGGKSTDVNRQVRYNQELVVGFFKRAILSLAPAGSICVTLFEGQPYELWCIRNLARHVGLQVERSFKFQSSAYPGYAHARTLGVIRNKKGEIGGGWKGENRPARSYVFRRKEDFPAPPEISKKRKGSPEYDEDG